MNVRSTGRLIGVAVLGVALLAACAGEGATPTSTTAPFPSELAACAPTRPRTDAALCNQQIVTVLQQRAQAAATANGRATRAAFEDAVVPILQGFQSTGPGFAYTVESPSATDQSTSTAPIRTRWVVSAEPMTVWACFEGVTVTVTTTACA